MGIKLYKPTTAGRRKGSVVDYSELTAKRPEKSLVRIWKENAGRNAQGKITTRHRGGSHKKFYRLVDFSQLKFDVPAKVLSLEYDPNRTSFIALIHYQDGPKSYVLAPQGLKAGDQIVSSLRKIEAKTGNRMPLEYIPTGTFIYNIELEPRHGGKLVRAAGTACSLMAVDKDFAQVKMPSGEIRLLPKTCQASVGQLSNIDHINVRLGKAGRMRWFGVRPSVRGKAMNPVDHPHGGGEGLSPIGLKHPKTPWGKPALGVKTRKKHKRSQKLIIQRRK
ncbi:MAG: 50S ribosomal protein L2 [Patescibacteria group bacterium]